MARVRPRDEAIRITTAAESRDRDLKARQRHYLFSMSLRVVCFIGAVIAGANGVNWLWPILVIGAIILPYVAVVGANAAHTRGEDFDLRDTDYRRELTGNDRPEQPRRTDERRQDEQ
jgi:hypothetical protein